MRLTATALHVCAKFNGLPSQKAITEPRNTYAIESQLRTALTILMLVLYAVFNCTSAETRIVLPWNDSRSCATCNVYSTSEQESC